LLENGSPGKHLGDHGFFEKFGHIVQGFQGPLIVQHHIFSFVLDAACQGPEEGPWPPCWNQALETGRLLTGCLFLLDLASERNEIIPGFRALRLPGILQQALAIAARGRSPNRGRSCNTSWCSGCRNSWCKSGVLLGQTASELPWLTSVRSRNTRFELCGRSNPFDEIVSVSGGDFQQRCGRRFPPG